MMSGFKHGNAAAGAIHQCAVGLPKFPGRPGPAAGDRRPPPTSVAAPGPGPAGPLPVGELLTAMLRIELFKLTVPTHCQA